MLKTRKKKPAWAMVFLAEINESIDACNEHPLNQLARTTEIARRDSAPATRSGTPLFRRATNPSRVVPKRMMLLGSGTAVVAAGTTLLTMLSDSELAV